MKANGVSARMDGVMEGLWNVWCFGSSRKTGREAEIVIPVFVGDIERKIDSLTAFVPSLTSKDEFHLKLVP